MGGTYRGIYRVLGLDSCTAGSTWIPRPGLAVRALASGGCSSKAEMSGFRVVFGLQGLHRFCFEATSARNEETGGQVIMNLGTALITR